MTTNQQTGPNFPALIGKMALSLDVDTEALAAVLRQQVLKNATPTDVAAFLIVATQYGLNPITKEIYAFPAKGGGIVPIVGVDGWIKLANKQPTFDGVSFEERLIDGKVAAVTCRVHRKDRQHPVEVTEYLEECKRPTDPWKQWPIRMLRHRAMVQGFRIAFGFSGIMEPDEAERAFDGPIVEGRQTGRARLADVVAETVRDSEPEMIPHREPGSDDDREPLDMTDPENNPFAEPSRVVDR